MNPITREVLIVMTDSDAPAPFDCPAELVAAVRKWLGKVGTAFFRKVLAEHGTLNAVWMDNGIPHAVHFREGMAVRNKLRELTGNAWTSHEYDDRWAAVVEKAIGGEE